MFEANSHRKTEFLVKKEKVVASLFWQIGSGLCRQQFQYPVTSPNLESNDIDISL
jgi:hypothetical protein